jgi:UDP-N-acetylglucosamine transferase subunit ALG13
VIFGTVGTHDAPFDRLVQALDNVAATLEEQVVIQTGSSKLQLRFASGIGLLTSHEFADLMRQARIIVTHGGDTILEAVDYGAAVVVVPRRRAFGEVIDDHQVELAEALAARRLVTWAEPEGLIDAINRARPTEARTNPDQLMNRVRSALRG